MHQTNVQASVLQKVQALALADGCGIQRLQSINDALLAAQSAAGVAPVQPARNEAVRRGKYKHVFGTQRANRGNRALTRGTAGTHGDAEGEDQFADVVGPSMQSRVREHRHRPMRKRANIMRPSQLR